MISFQIQSTLPTLNEYIDAERTNKYKASTLKKKATNTCKMYASQVYAKLRQPGKQYDLKIHWIVPNNKIDSDNIFFAIKFILDGMVDAKLITKDGRKNIRNIAHSIETVKGKYLITVIMIETENN